MPEMEETNCELSADQEKEKEQFENQRVQELRKLYEETDKYGELYDMAESLVDLDEQIFLWRMHHVTVVERIIGFKRGTGGSEGVGYLRSTLTKRCFPDLWRVRTALQA
jgi:tryptophan 2,3-dioxygenase